MSTTRVPEPTPSADYSVAALMAAHIIRSVMSIPAEPGPRRTQAILSFVQSEPMLGGAIYSQVSRLSNARYRLVSNNREALLAARKLLASAELQRGWKAFIMALFQSVLTCDYGGWFEIVRPTHLRGSPDKLVARKLNEHGQPVWALGDGTVVDPADVVVELDGPPLSLVVIDPLRIFPTGDPLYPAEFLDYDGRRVVMHRNIVGSIVDSIEPGKAYGRCAVSRALEAVRLMVSIVSWHMERLSGNMARTVVISNVSPRAMTAALEEASRNAVGAGNTRYVPPVFVSPLDPSATPSAEVIHMADLPPGFNLNDFFNWYLVVISNCLGVDYASLAPLPGSRLGTATEAEVMARLAALRSYGLLLGMLEHEISRILPDDVQFSFVAADYTEEQAAALAAKTRAEARAVRIRSGEIDARVARQLAADSGDMPVEYLRMLGESDVTPVW